MSAVDVALPRVRPELVVRPRPPGVLVHDPISGRKVALDATGKRVYDALGKARTLSALIRAVGLEVPVDAVMQRLAYFTRNALLEGPRADRLRTAYGSAEARTETRPVHELPLRHEPRLRHACQACGSCCSATDVGPLPESVVSAIQAVDWTDELGEQPLFREVEAAPGQTVRLMAMREDQCVFLDEDRLCRVHRRLGVDKKPVPCRQFPYVFTRVGDVIDVSLQMECRAFDRAQRAAAPPESSEADLRELLRLGAPLHAVPNVLDFGDAIAVARDEYARLEDALVAAVRSAGRDAVAAPLHAYLDAVAAIVSGIEGPILDAESAHAPPPAPLATDPTPFFTELAAFATQAAHVAAERGLPHLARRFTGLRDAVAEIPSAFDGRVHRYDDVGGAADLVADVLVAGLRGKEPVRRGVPLRLGLAILGLKGWLVAAGAAARARAACRVHVVAPHLVDSMVLASKLLRDRAVLDFLEHDAARVQHLFARGHALPARPPRPPPPQEVSR